MKTIRMLSLSAIAALTLAACQGPDAEQARRDAASAAKHAAAATEQAADRAAVSESASSSVPAVRWPTPRWCRIPTR